MDFLDIARMTVASAPGTGGTVALSVAVPGFLTFDLAGAVDGRTYRYGIKDGADREVSSGVYTASTKTLTRTVLKSTNSNAAINATINAVVGGVVAAEDLAFYSTIQRWSKTATAGQTAFTGADDNSVTLATNGLWTDVYLNGRLLSSTLDYTLTATTVTLLSAAKLGDTCAIVTVNTNLPVGTTQANSDSSLNLATTAFVHNYAAPLAAQAAMNLAINGDMSVSQQNGTTSLSSPDGKYPADQFFALVSSSGVFTAQNVAPPGSPGFGSAFQSCIQLQSTTADASIAAGEYAVLGTRIEGYRCAKLSWGHAAAQSVTLGFWVTATIAGTMTVSLRNAANNRSYLKDIAIAGSGVWEFKTIVIPGDITGTWLKTNGIGIDIGFGFAGGSTFQGTNGAWGAGNFIATANTTNFFSTNNNVACLTGVILLPGNMPLTGADAPLFMRSFDQELPLCQRYWQKSYSYSLALGVDDQRGMVLIFGGGTAITAVGKEVPLKATMRTDPTITTYSRTTGTTGKATDSTAGVDVNTTLGGRGDGAFYFTVAMASGQPNIQMHWTADARM